VSVNSEQDDAIYSLNILNWVQSECNCIDTSATRDTQRPWSLL